MKRAGWLLVFLGLLGSALVAWQRVDWEKRTFTLAYDYSEALNLARRSHTSIRETLGSLKEAGVASVAISQYTASQAYRQGKLLLWDGADLLTAAGRPQELGQLAVKPGRLYIMPRDPAVAADLAAILPDLGGKPLGKQLWQLSTDQASFLEQPLGLPREKLALSRSLGLAVIVRLQNDPRLRPETLAYLLDQGKGAQAFLSMGDEVLGYPDDYAAAARLLDKRRLPLALVEFSKQKGQDSLALHAGSSLLRLHTIPRPELERMSPQRAKERLIRAVTERSIPLLYLRPILQRRELLAANVSFVRDLRQSLTALGYQAEIVAPRPPWQSGIALFWLAALAPVGAWLLLADQAPAAIRKALVAGLFAAWLALPLWNILRARQLFALLAAVVFPLCAVLASRNVSSGVRRAAAAGLVAAAGGLVVSGLLGSWQFCLALWRFAGVKVAFLLPVGLLGLWAFSPLAGGGDWEEFKKWCQSQLAAPLRVWHVALGLVLAAILAVYLLRSGNTGLAPQWERTAREALEGIFGYRPRTKELLCYPLLVLAFSLKPSFWQRLCLPLGAIALVSTINSFAHAHTPLSASLVRSFWGLALGLCLGWLLTLLERKVIRHS